MLKEKKVLGSLILASFLIGCGGGDTSKEKTTIKSTEVTIVDPYIVGATVFWDKNKNGIKDPKEIESSPSDKNGKALINASIPEGEILIMNSQGKHGCKKYKGVLKAKYHKNGIISPLTTLEAIGFTKDEIVTLLDNTITKEEIYINPMKNITSSTKKVLEEDIKLIKANMAVNNFLSINGFNETKNTLESNISDLVNSLNLMNILINPTNITSKNNLLNIVKSSLAINTYISNKDSIDEKRKTLSNFQTNHEGKRDTYFNNLLTELTTNENVGLNIDGTIDNVCYSIDDYINDLENKTWFTNMNNDSYMSFKDTNIFYEYENSREIPYPNEEKTNFKLTFKKIDETHYENYINDKLNDTCKILSYEKISDIKGISVDAIKVKQKCTYANNNGIDYPNTYIGVTKLQANQITNIIDPNIISVKTGYKEGYLNKEDVVYSVYKNDNNPWTIDSLLFENGISYEGETKQADGNTYTIENGVMKNNDNGDIWYDKILSINPSYMRMCTIETYDKGKCRDEMKFYIYYDKTLAQKKQTELNSN